MINNNNTVEINLSRGDLADSLRLQMVPSSQTLSEQVSIAHETNSIFLAICSNELNQRNPNSGIIISETFTPHTKDKKSFEIVVNSKERVKVQHLQAHSKLQNNRWNYHTHCNQSTDREKNTPNNNNNLNESAFEDSRISDKELTALSAGSENSNLVVKMIQEQHTRDHTIESEKQTSPVCRTEDQENAFRRIEDVHNYSKLNRYNCSNGSSNSSTHEDEDDEEDDDEDNEILVESFETYNFFDRKQQRTRNFSSKNLRFSTNKLTSSSSPVTTQSPAADEMPQVPVRPEHHARRPMNAFLIFCKRHRAIVKDRYKSFENRAITKILGDWWASLEANEKKCYTSLAQQNKDAFFSANPNFKWYKLPAPPLRTLHTRPSNAERIVDNGEHISLDTAPNQAHSSCDHFFKLADETQMGDLSALMCDEKTNTQIALQRALGETTHYLSTQIPDLEASKSNWKAGLGKSYKRSLYQDNSFSSNSSEEDIVPKKTSRTCKGKIYQELVNSGQIAAITKKTKAPKINCLHQNIEQIGLFPNDEIAPLLMPYNSDCNDFQNNSTAQIKNSNSTARHVDGTKDLHRCSSPNYDLIHFDLEKKIKELPALNLDAYLQRKRNTKKKKKINSKKGKSTNSSNMLTSSITTLAPLSPPIAQQKSHSPPNQAVGSQKRKARKESITRRDISAIENEVASLLPMGDDFAAISDNNRFFYSKSPIPRTAIVSRSDFVTSSVIDFSSLSTESKPSVDQLSHLITNINNNISSTSDLFILAEVAAKRTEISSTSDHFGS